MKKSVFYRVYNAETNLTLGERVRPAHTFWTRLVGLLGSKELPEQSGLWLKPCSGIHTMGMNYPIDVVFLNKQHQVTKTVSNIHPNRFCPAGRGTKTVLELPTGTASRLKIKAGDQLVFDAVHK
jgi:uncharacterized membrane protein (UPF0127 family)